MKTASALTLFATILCKCDSIHTSRGYLSHRFLFPLGGKSNAYSQAGYAIGNLMSGYVCLKDDFEYWCVEEQT